MSTKHTPGPWELIWWGTERYPYPLSVLADNGGAWIARDGQVSSEANARLIAAAPDLLAAGRLLFSWFEITGSSLNARWERIPPVERKAIVDAFRAAIAKAEGRS